MSAYSREASSHGEGDSGSVGSDHGPLSRYEAMELASLDVSHSHAVVQPLREAKAIGRPSFAPIPRLEVNLKHQPIESHREIGTASKALQVNPVRELEASPETIDEDSTPPSPTLNTQHAKILFSDSIRQKRQMNDLSELQLDALAR